MRELDHRNISYRRTQTKSELQRLLLDNKITSFQVLCLGEIFDLTFAVHRDANLGQIIKHYNQDAKLKRFNIKVNSISCNETILSPKIKMSELVSIWQSSQLGIGSAIIIVNVY